MHMVGWSSSSCANVQPHLPLHPWKPIFVSSSSSYPFSQSEKKYLISINYASIGIRFPRPVLICSKSSASDDNDTNSQDSTTSSSSGIITGASAMEAKGSGTTARGRRLLKIREEKRKREYDRLHNYPAWAKVLEDACKEDTELRTVLGDSIGDPELMRKRVEERVRRKGRDFRKPKTGSVLAFKVSFRDFNPVDSHIWFELYGSPSDRDVDLIGSVIQSWYVMGRLGAFNSSNLQLANSSMEYDPLYDAGWILVHLIFLQLMYSSTA